MPYGRISATLEILIPAHLGRVEGLMHNLPLILSRRLFNRSAPMKITTQKITLAELDQMAAAGFGNLVKAVIDIDKELLALDAELH